MEDVLDLYSEMERIAPEKAAAVAHVSEGEADRGADRDGGGAEPSAGDREPPALERGRSAGMGLGL